MPRALRRLAFLDDVQAHPDVRFADAALKLPITEREFDDPLHYNDQKVDFVREDQEKAMIWCRQPSND